MQHLFNYHVQIKTPTPNQLPVIQVYPSYLANTPQLPVTFLTKARIYNHFLIEPLFNHSKFKIFYGDIYAKIGSSHSSSTPQFQLSSISLSGHGANGTFSKFLLPIMFHCSHLNMTGEFPTWMLENNRKLKRLSLVNISF